SPASTYTRLASSSSLNTSTTCSDSPLRISPLLTWTHTSCLPMVFISSAATTELSTPPERASSTFLLPTCLRISSTWSSMKFFMYQLGSALQVSKTNDLRTASSPSSDEGQSSSLCSHFAVSCATAITG